MKVRVQQKQNGYTQEKLGILTKQNMDDMQILHNITIFDDDVPLN